MNSFRSMFNSFLDVFGLAPKIQLSKFQRTKLLHEFDTFYDVNKDGRLQWKDFEMAKEYICTMSGWKPNSPQWLKCRQLFIELWRNLQDTGDNDINGEITSEEWLQLWTKILKAKAEYDRGKRNVTVSLPADEAGGKDEDTYIPDWFEKYVEYKFSLLDRAGDGVIDEEEFEYTLSDGFNIPPNNCRTAFRVISQVGTKKVDISYFRELALQFYLSDDPGDLGNFINGKLEYE